MAQFETWLKSDLHKIIQHQVLNGVVFTQDSQGNKVGVEVLDNGQPASISGSVVGYIVRPDDTTIQVTGTISGNKCSIVLPYNAYEVSGPLDIIIKLFSGSGNAQVRTTLGACRVYVQRGSTDSIITPQYQIIDLTTLLTKIDEMEQATTAANTAANKLNGMTASATSVSSSNAAKATVTTVGSGSNAHFNVAFEIPQSPADAALSNADIDSATA